MKLSLFAAIIAVYVKAQDEEEEEEEVEVTEPSQSCLHCRRNDVTAGFLTSYSYCEQTDECLMDAWNYINKKCTTEWKKGSSYEIAECNPEEITCPEFSSSPDKFGRYFNNTWSLAEGGRCTINVNANQGVARVIFDETESLGIDYEGVRIGEVITVESGVAAIEIYNGAEEGPLTFLISFSGASALSTLALTSVGAVLAQTMF